MRFPEGVKETKVRYRSKKLKRLKSDYHYDSCKEQPVLQGIDLVLTLSAKRGSNGPPFSTLSIWK